MIGSCGQHRVSHTNRAQRFTGQSVTLADLAGVLGDRELLAAVAVGGQQLPDSGLGFSGTGATREVPRIGAVWRAVPLSGRRGVPPGGPRGGGFGCLRAAWGGCRRVGAAARRRGVCACRWRGDGTVTLVGRVEGFGG